LKIRRRIIKNIVTDNPTLRFGRDAPKQQPENKKPPEIVREAFYLEG